MTPRKSNSSARPAMMEMRQMSMNVLEAKRVRMSPVIVVLKERMMGIFFPFSDREKIKRTNGSAAPAVPIRISRKRCSLRGSKGILHIRAKTNARIKATPSTRKARTTSFDLRDIA
jgi:hypothetical protein